VKKYILFKSGQTWRRIGGSLILLFCLEFLQAQEDNRWEYWQGRAAQDLYKEWSVASQSLDSAYFYAQKRGEEPLLAIYTRLYQVVAAEYHFQLDSMLAWIQDFEFQLKHPKIQDIEPSRILTLVDQAHLYKGIHAFMIKDLFWAENEAFIPLLKRVQSRTNPSRQDSLTLTSTLRYLGSICQQLHRYAEAIDYYRSSIIVEKKVGRLRKVMLSHSHLGKAYHEQGQIDSARKHYTLAYQYFQQAYQRDPNRNRTSLSSSCTALAELERTQKAFEKARGLLKEVFQTMNEDHNLFHEAKLEEARVYLDQSDWNQAQRILRDQVKWYQAGEKSREGAANAYGLLAESEAGQRNWALALGYYQQAEQALYGTGSVSARSALLNPGLWVEILAKKADMQAQLCLENPDDAQLRKEARNAYDVALTSIDTLRWQVGFEDDLIALTEASYELFVNALKLEAALSPDAQTDARLWKWMSLSHGLALRQTRAGLAIQHALPDSLRKQYQILAANSQRAQTALLNAVQGSEGYAGLQQNWTTAEQARQQWLKKYADFRPPSYGGDLEDIRKQIGRNTGLLTFLDAGDQLYRLLVTRDEVRFDSLTWSHAHAHQIIQFQESIWLPYQDAQQATQRALISGQQMHNWLIGDLEAALPEQLLVMPDGMLWYLPFDLLENQQGELWLDKRSVSLGHSPDDFWNPNPILPARKGLFMAPAFPELGDQTLYASAREGLGPLRHNQLEVSQIHELLEGEIFKGDAATREAFIEAAPSYSVLHLATHGLLPDEEGKWAFLAFASQDTLNLKGESYPGINALFAQEIQKLDLPAELVVLSACKTGVGKANRGEGLQSLGRAFMQAGARSLVATLWAVNDETTARFMRYFYQELTNGAAKDEALAAAKQQMRLEGEGPYHWAGFVLIGETAPLEGYRTSYWAYILLFVSLLVLGGILLRKRSGQSDRA